MSLLLSSSGSCGDVVPELEPDPRWLRLWARLRAIDAEAWAHAEWHRLVTRYSEPHRAYHTLEHVLECQRELDPCRALASDPDALEAALWFHDAVYDPRSSDNEEASAALAREVLERTDMDPDRVERVERLILCTRHAAVAVGHDEALIVDIDLAILGAPSERFDGYEQAIRREYAWVPEAVFRTQRALFLEALCARPHLFTTERFRQRLESQGRENLARSISRLRHPG
jgi:predicted metal-dependent HD superfamily phosphohydrolase